jgi:hypothetical protein
MNSLRVSPLAILLLAYAVGPASAEQSSQHALTAIVDVADREGTHGGDAAPSAGPGMLQRILDRILGSEMVGRFHGPSASLKAAPQQAQAALGAQRDQESRPLNPPVPHQDPAPPALQHVSGPPASAVAPSRGDATLSSRASEKPTVVIGEGRLITHAEAEATLKRYGSIPGTRGNLTLVSSRQADAVIVGEGRLITAAEAEAVVKRYGSCPGGFVLEEAAVGVSAFKTVRYDPSANAFILDERVSYGLPISVRGAADLARALAEDDRVGVSLGEELEIVYGKLPRSSDVALDLKLADNFLGDIILPPQEWVMGYRFANGFEPRQDLGSGDAAVFFKFSDLEFALQGERLGLARARFDVRIVPIVARKAPDGGFLPDFEAIAAGVGFEPYQAGASHIADNIDYYLKERIVERVLAYAEVAGLLRSLKAAGVDLHELARNIKAHDSRSTSRRPARTLVEGWRHYLREIQTDHDFANWPEAPYDLYVNRKAPRKAALGPGR